MSHLQMTGSYSNAEMSNTAVAIYTHHMSSTYASQHVFCKYCGIHLFHMELSRSEHVAINVHCIDDDLIQEMQVFIPQNSCVILFTMHFMSILIHRSSLYPKVLVLFLSASLRRLIWKNWLHPIKRGNPSFVMHIQPLPRTNFLKYLPAMFRVVFLGSIFEKQLMDWAQLRPKDDSKAATTVINLMIASSLTWHI